jgi:hypothetical protein
MSPRRALAKFAGYMEGLTADATRSSRIAMTASSARDVQAARVTSEDVKQNKRLGKEYLRQLTSPEIKWQGIKPRFFTALLSALKLRANTRTLV